MTGTPDVIHDLVFAIFGKRESNASGQIVEDVIPGHPLPLPFAALARPSQRIKDALRVIHLIDGRRPLGAVAPPAAGVRGIPLKLVNAVLFLIHPGKKPAGRLAVETDGGDQRVMLLNLARPLTGVVFSPVIPPVGGRKAGEAFLWIFEVEYSGIQGLLHI